MSRSTVISDPDNDYLAQVDQYSHYLIGMESVHARIHSGAFFSCSFYSASLANGAEQNILIQTAAGGAIHLRTTLATGGNATLNFYEGTTVSAAGTDCTPVNRNRRSANTATCTVTTTPTVTGVGTLLDAGLLAAGSGGNAKGGNTVSFEEWILQASTIYLVKVTNIAGTAQAASTALEFYDTTYNSF